MGSDVGWTGMNDLDVLRLRYPWPAKKPPFKFDGHGWLADKTRAMLARYLSRKTVIILELGSWLGCSARFMASRAPNATVICIDHWKGSAKRHCGKDIRKRLPRLYDRFIANMWPLRNRIIPMKSHTVVGMKEVDSLSIVPDLVYVDAGHDTTSVQNDVITALSFFPETRIVGDDWTWATVRLGIQIVAEKFGFGIEHNRTAWTLSK